MSIPAGDIGSIFGNSAVSGLASSAINSGACTAIGSQFDAAYKAIGDLCKVIFDFVKFDIFMNFFQQIGLWFSKFEFPRKFEELFHKFMDFVSLVWNFVLGITELQIFYIWAVVSVLLFILWLVQKRSDPLPEIKGPNTFGWEQRGSIWNLWTYGLVTLLTTLYLPAITASFRVLFCFENLMFPYELNCYAGMHWIHFAVALFVFLFVGLYLPYQIYLTINKYQPAPDKYDTSGEKFDKVFDKEKILDQYRKTLAKDQCPYNFLYSGYEYGWSAYKVITMVFKMLLIIPMIPFFTESLAPACVSMSIVAIYAITSAFSSPFILPQDDWIDLSARVTAVLTIGLQICVIKEVIASPFDGVVLSVINIANLAVMALIFVGNLDFVKLFFRKKWGSIKLSPGMAYNPPNERLNRIWQRFWRGLFSSSGTLLPAFERLEVMESVFSKFGKQAYKDSLQPPNAQIAQSRRMCIELEGVDCYFRRENVEQETRWGRMFIIPFPFRVNMVYDDNVFYELKDDDEVIEFVKQNTTEPNVVQGRKVRQALRCLDGSFVNFTLDAVVPSSKGGPKEEVPVHFERGIMKVKKVAHDPFANGFKVKITYTNGEAVLSNGKVKNGIRYTAKKEKIGITDTYQLTSELQRLFNDPENKAIIQQKWKPMMERITLMHEDLEEERREADDILSYNFWMLVFFNDHIPMDELVLYLTKFEQNQNIHDIVNLYKDDIVALYSRLAYYDCHPAVATWYCFFDDIALYNHMIDGIQNHPELFDISNPNSLAYHPSTVNELKLKLEEAGLRSKRGGGLFNDEVLKQLEDQLNHDCEQEFIPKKVPHVNPMSSNLSTDTRCISTPFMTENTSYLFSAAMCIV